MKAWTYHF